MSSTTSLSSNARRLLEAAADRPGHSLLPLPPDVPVRGAVRQRLLAGLLRAGFVEEVSTTDAASTWRTDESGRGVALRLTAGGFAAIGRTPVVTRRTARLRRPPAAVTRASTTAGAAPLLGAEAAGSALGEVVRPAPAHIPAGRPPGGKLGRVLASLSSDAGAALPELVALTGWQPHTTRAALTRLRRRGYALERLEVNGRRVYRLGAVG